jgi:hypothetical protein
VVIGGVVFQNQMEQKYQSLVAALGAPTANLLSGGSAGANVGVLNSLPQAERRIAQQAFFESLRTMWILVGSIFSLFFLFDLGKPGDYQGLAIKSTHFVL